MLLDNDVFQALDELEAVVENAKGGFMGRRVINEEEFWTRSQNLRSKLQALSSIGRKTTGFNTSAVPILIAWAQTLSREEQEQISAALSQR